MTLINNSCTYWVSHKYISIILVETFTLKWYNIFLQLIREHKQPMQWCVRVVNTQLSLTCGKKNPPPPISSNSKLSRYNNQNASSVPTCHILKCFPCYISSVCCIDMTENWSRQPFIDLPSGMKNCVLTWTELVHRSFPSLADIPERGKTLPGERNP